MNVPQVGWEARKALIRAVTLTEMNQVRQQFNLAVLNLAHKLIHPNSQKRLKQLLKKSKQVGP